MGDTKFKPVNPGGLTDDQARAVVAISEWYNSKELIFTLYGQAGVGKTFLLNYLLKNIFIHATCITAPTHKAVKVIEDVTGRKGKTLQSLHGLRPNVNLEDFDIDKIKFDTIGTEMIKNYRVVVIDECSQVGTALYELNARRASQYGVKILYLGDACQLPPVRERISKTFLIATRYELTQVVRQDDTNPLLPAFKLLREDIFTGSNKFLNHIHKVPTNLNEKGEGYICVDINTFKTEIINVFKSRQFETNPQNFVRYAAFTNDSVNSWNSFIRNNTIKQYDDVISNEDLVVGYKTIVNEFNDPLIINSEDYIIEQISKRTSDDKFEIFVVTFRSLLDGRSFTSFVVDHDSPTFEIYKQIITALRFNAINANSVVKGRAWRKYFEYKDRFLILQPFNIYDENGRATIVPKDLDYGYGLTTHKLQGSTVTHVFVNLLDMCYFNSNRDNPITNTRSNPYAIEFRNKLMYTAISRAKKVAILLV